MEWQIAAGQIRAILPGAMSLANGAKLGPYEVLGPLGAGGMGEVYRAKDTRLQRTVAIKILPAQFTADPISKQRFEREAKTISSLNHPHICVLYDIGHQEGVDYIVMECVEGETLAKRLEKGPLPFDQALKFGAQMADALDKAHRSGIVHRDLKPGNIMLTPTGAKLLDFGLAKESVPVANLATLTAAIPTSPVTERGTIVGTFQYMSPEQVEGRKLDGRSDIFSLGAVLYEMLTGKRAFEGKSQLSVASAILEKDPAPIGSIKPMTPPALEHAISRCLAKDPEERWQAARDIAHELKWIAETGSQASASASENRATARWGWLGWGVAFVAALTALLFGLRLMRGTAQPSEVARFTVAPPPGANFTFGGFRESAALSPDGRKILFAARSAGQTKLWLRSLDAFDARALPGTDDAESGFWSPDGENVAFIANGKLKRVSIAGGSVQTVCEVDGSTRGGTWNREGVILFGTSPGTIYGVPASGGVPHGVTTLDVNRHDLLHRWPSFLPDGEHFVYLASQTSTINESDAIFVGSLSGKEEKMLLHASSPAIYASGYLIYLSGQTLLARPFDPEKLEFTGNAESIADGVLFDPYFGDAAFSVSSSGVLLYQQGALFSGYSLAIRDREGKELATVKEPGMAFYPRFSPNGKQVAYHTTDLQNTKSNVWVWDIASGNRTRLSFNPFYNRTPVWSPDGTQVAYVATGTGHNTVFLRHVAGIDAEERGMELPPGVPSLTQWTPDGKYLLFDDATVDTRKLRVFVVPLEGGGPAAPLIESGEANIGSGVVSTDGHWLAYRSTETGRSEVYITSFPKIAGKQQVSVAGGGGPRWRADGKEIYYLAPDLKLMAAELKESEGSLQVVSVHALFQTSIVSSQRGTHFDVTADGTKFVLLQVTADENSAPLNIVLNWTAELKK